MNISEQSLAGPRPGLDVRTELSSQIARPDWRPSTARRHLMSMLFRALCLGAVLSSVAILVLLLGSILFQGYGPLSLDFLNNFPSRNPSIAGIKAAIWGSVWLMGITVAVATPIGVGAAVYLEEFTRDTPFRRFIDLNIANLAGVPSIVFGMLGLVIFVRLFGLERSVLAGGLTLAAMVLPVVIVSSREALKAVPAGIRHAAFAMGATRWQTVRSHILPAAAPGIMTGIILSLSRALGETAPLVMIGALSYVAFVPEGPLDGFTALPVQIFNWAQRPQEDFHTIAATGIICLLAVLLGCNATAIIIRHKFQRYMKW